MWVSDNQYVAVGLDPHVLCIHIGMNIYLIKTLISKNDTIEEHTDIIWRIFQRLSSQ